MPCTYCKKSFNRSSKEQVICRQIVGADLVLTILIESYSFCIKKLQESAGKMQNILIQKVLRPTITCSTFFDCEPLQLRGSNAFKLYVCTNIIACEMISHSTCG